jgi:hypothetical protein
MSQESFSVLPSMDSGELQTKVQAIFDAVVAHDKSAKPHPDNAQASMLAAGFASLATLLATNASTRPKEATAAAVENATKHEINQVRESIAELRCLILQLWWLDHGCRYLFTGHTDHVTGLVYDQVGLRSAPGTATADAFKGAAGDLLVEARLLPCDVDGLLQIVKAYHAHVPLQPSGLKGRS